MSELPIGWTEATILDYLCSNGLFADGDWIESKDQDVNGQIRLLQLADVGDGRFIDKSFRFVNDQTFAKLRCTEIFEGDVLIARMPDPLGRACLVPRLSQRCITVVDVAIFRPGPNSVLPEWFVFFLNSPSVREQIDTLSSGTTRKRIARGNLATLPLPTPPVAEQRRIVAKLDSVLAKSRRAREALDAIPPLLEQLRQSTLAAAFRGDLTADWRAKNPDVEPASELLKRIRVERRQKWEAAQLAKLTAKGKTPTDDRWKAKYVEPEPVDDSELPELPKGWCWASFSEILLSIEAGASFQCEERPPSQSEVGVLKVSAVSWGRYDEEESKTCRDPARIDEALYVRPGDFLLSRANTIELVGRCVIVGKVTKRVMLSDKILRLQMVGMPDEFVLDVLGSPWGRSEIERLSTGNQLSMRNIGQEKLKDVRIPLPPLAEGVEISKKTAALLNRLTTVNDEFGAQHASLDEISRGLLAKAFRGELVPQDPNDEPAAVMLERLRAERAAKTSPPRGAKGRANSPSPRGEGNTGGEVPRRGRPKKG